MAAQLLAMLYSILLGFRLVTLVLGGHQQVALENVALRNSWPSSNEA
jgi:hypothetical protein